MRDAVGDLVEIIQAYQSKGTISQVVMSTFFKRRQEEAEAVIDAAISRLHVRRKRYRRVLQQMYHVSVETMSDVWSSQTQEPPSILFMPHNSFPRHLTYCLLRRVKTKCRLNSRF